MPRLKMIYGKNESGFTLIELMIVVGIIGILVSIAAPNFARYQSKARQSEAKIGLSAIYAGEQSFYSEYSSYIGAMDSIGYSPEGNKRFYTIGFSLMNTTSVSGFSDLGTVASYTRVNFPSSWNTCASQPLNGYIPWPTSNPSQFDAAAMGQIRSGVGCDTWTINESKFLQNSTVNL
jgi:prepilin-type N-terminal cleavage/methylation domain-containing protein